MNFGEYEDRFRRPAPSWRQILATNQTRNRTRRRNWRYLLAAALITFVTLMELASHRTAHGRGGARPKAELNLHLMSAVFHGTLDWFEAPGSR